MNLAEVVEIEGIDRSDLERGAVFEPVVEDGRVDYVEHVGVLRDKTGPYLVSGKVRCEDGAESLALLEINTDYRGMSRHWGDPFLPHKGKVVRAKPGFIGQKVEGYIPYVFKIHEDVEFERETLGLENLDDARF